ncbi:hypothetical protein D3C87_1062950 [compost metagenome]
MRTDKLIILGSIAAIIILLASVLFGAYINTTNQEIRIHEHYEAKQKDITNVYDDVWKTISQTAQVSEDYRASFDSIYSHIMSDRYSKGDGSLMKWITESNPQFDTSLYNRLAVTIESKRGEFKNAQTELLDVVRNYNTFISVFPNRLFLSGKQRLEAKLILSTRTNKAIDSGVDDDVKLFNNK